MPKLDISVLATSLGPIDMHKCGWVDLTLFNLSLLKLATHTLSEAFDFEITSNAGSTTSSVFKSIWNRASGNFVSGTNHVTTAFVPSTDPKGDSNSAVYCTKKVSLDNPAYAIHVLFDGYRATDGSGLTPDILVTFLVAIIFLQMILECLYYI